MEGTLEIWQGMIGLRGWTKKYFALNDSILICYDTKDGEVEAKVHLKVATLDVSERKERQFTIYTGISKFKLRASSGELKIKWVDSM